MDKLLASAAWGDPEDGSESDESWARIMSKTGSRLAVENAIKAFKEKNPDFRWGDEIGG